jgi:hypothetical protein
MRLVKFALHMAELTGAKEPLDELTRRSSASVPEGEPITLGRPAWVSPGSPP